MRRKKWIIAGSAVLLAAAVLVVIMFMMNSRPAEDSGKEWYELGMTSDDVLNQVLLFYLGEAWQGMSDINECLETVDRVDPDDPESWAREWRQTAERLEKARHEKLDQGRTRGSV